MNIIDKPCKHPHPKRHHPIVGHIIHTTGDTDLDKIIDWYQNGSSGIGPHYMISYDGTIYKFVDESECAYHAGYGGEGDDSQVKLYSQGKNVWLNRINKEPWTLPEAFDGYTTWQTRWPNLSSPLELVVDGHPNDTSIGIELQEPIHHLPDKFFDAQYDSLVELLKDSAARNGLLLDRQHILGHYDVNPIARSGKDGDRDPGEAFKWDRLLAAL